MNVNISPHKPGDGGILCLPLKRNVPNPKDPDWKLTTCPICGSECWESDLARETMKAEGLKAACTACALTGSKPEGPDISPAFAWNRMDAEIAAKLVKIDDSPRAIKCFRNNRQYLSNYAFWFYLSTLWVQRTEGTDLEEWKRYFSSDRPDRDRCIMKPSELRALSALPDVITAYRAHRPGETDWIAYSTSIDAAARFAIQRGVRELSQYSIQKADVLAYFTRRKENELIVLDKARAVMVGTIKIVTEKGEDHEQ